MASGHTGNVVPGNRLRVRISCPPPNLRYCHALAQALFTAMLLTIMESILAAASACMVGGRCEKVSIVTLICDCPNRS
jgi:hypothetical protein